MAPPKAKVGQAQKLAGCVILAVLGLIIIWLLVQQSRFNPAVTVAMRVPLAQGRPQTISGQPRTVTAALLPEVSGFTPLAPSETFGPENLSDKINGKAELYLSASFQEMSCRTFRSGEAHVEVYLYDMGAPSNAYAVFSSQRRPDAANIPLTANAYATTNGLFFTQGRFYVEIIADRAAMDMLRSSLEAYAAQLLAKLPSEGETPDLAALLPKEGLEPDSVRLSPADTFGLAGFNNVLTGEYSLRGEKATAFVAERHTPEQAQAEARRYLDFLAANGYQETRWPGVLGDTHVLSLEESFEIIFVQGRTLAGVHDASSLAAALELAAQVKTALRGKP
jgi:hypothetical protein